MSTGVSEGARFDLMSAIGRVASKDAKPVNSQSKAALNEYEASGNVPKQAVSHRPALNGLEQWPLPGLAPMTRVRTSFGDVPAIALRKGDKVQVRSGEYLAIEWINRIKLDAHVLRLKPDSNPVVLSAGSLGRNAPKNDIMVSPRQVVCADDASGLASEREAAMLMSKPGVRRLVESELSYTMFHLGEDAEVYCEGLYMRFAMDA